MNRQMLQFKTAAAQMNPAEANAAGAHPAQAKPGSGRLLPGTMSGEQTHRAEPDEARIVVAECRPESLERLYAGYDLITQRSARQLRRAAKCGAAVTIGMVLVDVAAMFALAVSAPETRALVLRAGIGLLALGAALLVLCGFTAVAASATRRRSLTKLAAAEHRQGDLSLIGPLVETLCDQRLRRRACETLVCLLPQLREEDARLLNALHRQCLCDALRSGAREEHLLRLTILRSFARIGDGSMLTQVERIADSPAANWRQRELKAAAQECLPILKRRTRHEADSRSLLRAAGGDVRSSSLLRPAAPALAASEHLLRTTGTSS